jgi:hypothetical protein
MDLPTCEVWEACVCIKWYQSAEGFFVFCSREREFTMPPRRRDMQSPNPREDREMPRRRGRKMTDLVMERQMCDLRARLEYMETMQRCTVSARDLSDSKSEAEAEREEEVAAEDASNKCLIRAIARMGAREKMDIPVYEGNLYSEELLDWIRALDTYFEYEDVKEDNKVKHIVTRLKGHETLWWEDLQAERHCKGK